MAYNLYSEVLSRVVTEKNIVRLINFLYKNFKKQDSNKVHVNLCYPAPTTDFEQTALDGWISVTVEDFSIDFKNSGYFNPLHNFSYFYQPLTNMLFRPRLSNNAAYAKTL
ncbi:MAG: hypothetical protein MRQ09_01905 [Candidatus Midichloria sp.]|nr:hypothetical protein [Candidatus Midichloria sp.]